jgi:hypothetical protein
MACIYVSLLISTVSNVLSETQNSFATSPGLDFINNLVSNLNHTNILVLLYSKCQLSRSITYVRVIFVLINDANVHIKKS